MNKIVLTLEKDENIIKLESPRELSVSILKELNHTIIDNLTYKIGMYPYNSFVIVCLLLKSPHIFEFSEDDLYYLKTLASSVVKPKAFIQGEKSIGINIPDIKAYKNLMGIVSAKHAMMNLWTIPFSRLYEAYRIISNWKHPFLPPIKIDENLSNLVTYRLQENSNMEDLFNTEITELYSVHYGWQVNTEGFSKLKYNRASDLLLRRPTRYIDRTEIVKFNRAPFGRPALIRGKIVKISSSFSGKLHIVLDDESNPEIEISFFGAGYLTQVYSPGDEIIVSLVKIQKNMANGDAVYSVHDVETLPIAPVYRQAPSKKITTKLLTSCVNELLMRFDGSNLANYIKGTDYSFWELIEKLHFPKDVQSYMETLDQLAYIELVYLQLLFIEKKNNTSVRAGVSKSTTDPKFMNAAINALPYELTNGQKESIKHIISRLRTNQYEDILLSGDVGSGKTNVAQASCLYAIDSGFQAALIGPTEILAQQLYNTFTKFLEPLEEKPTIAYLSGNTKAKEKREILKGVADGSIDILVGTHGVFNVEDWHNLGLIIIDEQQKFGTHQREKLIYSRKDGKLVDLLAQTATPIPRSTALAFYGDIDLVSLTEKPGNRKENITRWIKEDTKDFLSNPTSETWSHIFSEINDGRQAFIVTPAVEEGSKMASVKDVTKIIEAQLGKKIKICQVHGQMTKEKQNKTIEEFRDKKYDVLIASSVIEVGMDIPNATVILVLDADRFGASSLHQIRGRVGRSGYQGYCYLISNSTTKSAERRLGALVDSNNGFDIALVDLDTRKEGDILGAKQSGESILIFCDLADHSKLIEMARTEAQRIYDSNDKEKALKDAKTFLRRTEEE